MLRDFSVALRGKKSLVEIVACGTHSLSLMWSLTDVVDAKNTIHIWNANASTRNDTLSPIASVKTSHNMVAIDQAPTSKDRCCVITVDGKLALVDLRQGQQALTQNQTFFLSTCQWHPKAEDYILTGAQHAQCLVWDTRNVSMPCMTFGQPKNNDFVTNVEWSPWSRNTFLATRSGIVDVWDAEVRDAASAFRHHHHPQANESLGDLIFQHHCQTGYAI
jgi:WD40 repeat protein